MKIVFFFDGGDDDAHYWYHYPLVNVYITMENYHFSWKHQLFLWPFSIANC